MNSPLTSIQDTFEEVFHKRIANGDQVTAMTVGPTDHRGTRFATGTRDMLVHVWIWDEQTVTCVFATSLQRTVPVGLTFLDNHAHDVQVFGLWDGKTQVH